MVAHVVSSGSSYVAVAPTRITDTRPGSGEPNAGATLGANEQVDVQVTGVGPIPSSGVSAAVLNVTAVGPTQASFLTVYPTGTNLPLVSNLNTTAGVDVANLVTVPVGSTGAVMVYNHTGSTNVVVDVEGYYTSAVQTTGLYGAVNPTRVLGSRQAGVAIPANTSTAVTVTGGADSVPATATAIVANLTVADGTQPGFLTAYPAGESLPVVSNLNFVAGQVVANRITIPVGSNGQIEIYNHTGTANVDLDVDGYYTGASGTAGSAYFAMTPTRLVDTRSSMNGTTIAANSSEVFSLAGTSIPAGAGALAGNVTVVPGDAPGFLTVYPTSDTTRPVASDVNWAANEIVPNFSPAPLNGSGTISMYDNIGGPVNVILDAFGYFLPVTAGVAITSTPSSLPANGSATSSVVTTVTNSSGPVFGDPVTLVETPSTTGACGTLNPTTGTTNAAGQVTSTYTASTVVGSCTITATEANNGLTGSTTISQTGGNTVTVSPSSSTLAATGSTTQSFTATVDTVSGPTVGSGDTVSFAVSGQNACGSVSPTSATTTASGTVTTVYTTSTTAGFCTVKATESQFGATGTAVVDQTASPAIATPTVTITASPATVAANGTATSSITGSVIIPGSAGVLGVGATSPSPVANDQVLLTGTPSVTGACGTFSPRLAVTNSSGNYSTTYTAGTTGGTCTVTAKEADAAATASTPITQTAVN